MHYSPYNAGVMKLMALLDITVKWLVKCQDGIVRKIIDKQDTIKIMYDYLPLLSLQGICT